MTVTLELEPEVESLLEKRARAEGCDVKGYVEKLVKRDVNRAHTFDEILAPFATQWNEADSLTKNWTRYLLQVGE